MDTEVLYTRNWWLIAVEYLIHAILLIMNGVTLIFHTETKSTKKHNIAWIIKIVSSIIVGIGFILLLITNTDTITFVIILPHFLICCLLIFNIFSTHFYSLAATVTSFLILIIQTYFTKRAETVVEEVDKFNLFHPYQAKPEKPKPPPREFETIDEIERKKKIRKLPPAPKAPWWSAFDEYLRKNPNSKLKDEIEEIKNQDEQQIRFANEEEKRRKLKENLYLSGHTIDLVFTVDWRSLTPALIKNIRNQAQLSSYLTHIVEPYTITNTTKPCPSASCNDTMKNFESQINNDIVEMCTGCNEINNGNNIIQRIGTKLYPITPLNYIIGINTGDYNRNYLYLYGYKLQLLDEVEDIAFSSKLDLKYTEIDAVYEDPVDDDTDYEEIAYVVEPWNITNTTNCNQCTSNTLKTFAAIKNNDKIILCTNCGYMENDENNDITDRTTTKIKAQKLTGKKYWMDIDEDLYGQTINSPNYYLPMTPRNRINSLVYAQIRHKYLI